MNIKRLLLGLLVASFSNVAIAVTEVTIVADDWMPVFGKAGTEHPGFMLDVAKSILEPAGYSVMYHNISSWVDAVASTRAGKYNCIVGAEEFDAPDFVYTTKPVVTTTTEFYVKKGNKWRYNNTFNSLDGVRVSTISANTYKEEMDKYLKENKKGNVELSGDTLDRLVLNLLSDKTDVVVENKMIMEYKLKQMNLLDQVESAGVYANNNLYIACSPAQNLKDFSKNIVSLLDDGIAKIQQDGRLKTILATYGIKY